MSDNSRDGNTVASSGTTEAPGAPAAVTWAQGDGLEPGDAYVEGGYLVFTAQFHLRRGYCCNSGCRHCPYR